MVFLILESLGSTELAFILVMALVFFGPRKLPQLSRTLGKNIASFRRASEDFKRTWDKEVSLEELNLSRLDLEPSFPVGENSILAGDEGHQEGHQDGNQEAHQENSRLSPTAPTIAAVDQDHIVPRQSRHVDPNVSSEHTDPVGPEEPLSKRDWL